MKRNKLSVILYCIMLLPLSSVYAQIVDGTDLWLDKLRLNKAINGIGETSYSSITGDPYIFKDFHQCQLKLKTGETSDHSIDFSFAAHISYILQ